MCKALVMFNICFLFHSFVFGEGFSTYNYCVPVNKIDFYPFREITDGKDLAYLIFLKSYISTDENETGILSKYEFSPNGKIFTGRVSEGLKWSNGRLVTAREAAFGIAKGLQYRTLGKRVKILGTEKMNQQGWYNRSYDNIEFVDDKTFKIKFESDIENLTGVIREALSTNSRHNRLWPIKLGNEDSISDPEVLFKFSFTKVDNFPAMQINGNKISFDSAKNCISPTFSIFPEVFQSLKGLISKTSPSPSAIHVLMNTKRLKLRERKALASWLRFSFKGLPGHYGVKEVDSFFLPGEFGFDKQSKWPTSESLDMLEGKKLVIAVSIPLYITFIENAAKKSDNKIEIISLPSDRKDIDAQIAASGMIEGRHVFFQDMLKWKYVNDYLSNAKKTKTDLLKIAEISASTLPADQNALKEFEKNAINEISVVPIARRYPTAFSQPNLGLCLVWTIRGELSFSMKAKCD